jgi:hypothetical protein
VSSLKVSPTKQSTAPSNAAIVRRQIAASLGSPLQKEWGSKPCAPIPAGALQVYSRLFCCAADVSHRGGDLIHGKCQACSITQLTAALNTPEAGIGIVLRVVLIEIWIAIAIAFADEVWRSSCGEIVVLICISLALKERLGLRRRTIHRPQAGSRR